MALGYFSINSVRFGFMQLAIVAGHGIRLTVSMQPICD